MVRPGRMLDPFDIFKQCVLDLPINAPKVRINVGRRSTRDRSGEGIRSAHSRVTMFRVYSCDFNTGRQTEGFCDAGSPGPPDILLV